MTTEPDTRRGLRLLLAVLSLFPMDAQCGAPFATDDPATVELGHVELLLFYQSTLATDARTGTLPGLESHFGALEGLELDLVTPLAFSTPSNSAHTSRGYGDTLVGLKYRLLEESETFPLVSLVPKVAFSSGNADRGLGNGGEQVFLALAAQKSWSDLQTYGNAGYWINNGPQNRNYWFLGWQTQYQLSDHWVIGSEVFYTTPQALGQASSVGFNIGGYYIFDPHNQLLFSLGRGLQNAAESNRVSAYLGYQLSF